MKDFPISLVTLGPGTHHEDESLDYLPLPKDMDTYRPPMLPEPEELVGLDQARQVLQQVLALLQRGAEDGAPGLVPLGMLAPRDFRIVNQVLGEGEVSAIVQLGASNLEVRVQESVFAGVWRLMTWRHEEGRDSVLVDDAIEVGSVPSLFAATAAEDVWPAYPLWSGPLPPNVQNAPLLVDEIRDQVARCSRTRSRTWSTSRCCRSRPRTSAFWITSSARAACSCYRAVTATAASPTRACQTAGAWCITTPWTSSSSTRSRWWTCPR